MAVPKSLMRKKSKEKEQTLAGQIQLIAICNQNFRKYKPVTLNELNCSCLRHIINILLTELSRSVWENLDLSRCVQTSLRSFCTHDLGQDSPIQTFLLPHYRSRCRSRWENLDRFQYRFQPIKFVNLVVPSPCETEPYKKKHSNAGSKTCNV